jgi:uncharacterized protein YndB with AHSA1/START domain
VFTIDISIKRPPSEVFSYLEDVDRATQWYSAVKRVTPADNGRPAVGKRYVFERELGGRSVENEVEITELKRPTAFTIESKSGPTPFIYRYSLIDENGTTHLRLDGEISGEGLPGVLALAAPLASKAFERGMRTNLVALKKLIEAS